MGFLDFLKGESTSSTTNQVDLSSASTIIVDNIMNCKGNSTVSQTIDLSGSYMEIDNFQQKQAYKLDTQCTQKLENNMNLIKKVANAIAASAEANAPGIVSMLTTSGSNVRNTINQQVKDYFESKAITNIVTTVNAIQGLNISGHHIILKNTTQDQAADLLQKGIQDSLNKLSVVQDINNGLKGDSKSTITNPISDIINSVFGGMANMGMIFGVVAVIIVIVIVAFFKEPIMAFFGVGSNQRPENIHNSPYGMTLAAAQNMLGNRIASIGNGRPLSGAQPSGAQPSGAQPSGAQPSGAQSDIKGIIDNLMSTYKNDPNIVKKVKEIYNSNKDKLSPKYKEYVEKYIKEIPSVPAQSSQTTNQLYFPPHIQNTSPQTTNQTIVSKLPSQTGEQHSNEGEPGNLEDGRPA